MARWMRGGRFFSRGKCRSSAASTRRVASDKNCSNTAAGSPSRSVVVLLILFRIILLDVTGQRRRAQLESFRGLGELPDDRFGALQASQAVPDQSCALDIGGQTLLERDRAFLEFFHEGLEALQCLLETQCVIRSTRSGTIVVL